jgi:release factor glutamine methyltransferase
MVETVKKALENAVAILGEREHTTPSLDARLLLAYVLDVDKSYLYLNLEREISGDRLGRFYELVEERAKGYPLQYILQSQEFMGLDFYVEEGVLVPRPDTEILVEKLLEISKKTYGEAGDCSILEIGSGSGAIAVSLAYYLKNAKVYSIDIDETPVRIATKNAKKHGVEDRTCFLQGDLFEPLDGLEGISFDIIVSNPPYIKSEEIDTLQLEVSTFEPRLALDGGEDGLEFYRKIVEGGLRYLKPGGILAFEIGYDQREAVVSLMEDRYRDISTLKDYGGNDRVVIGFAKE